MQLLNKYKENNSANKLHLKLDMNIEQAWHVFKNQSIQLHLKIDHNKALCMYQSVFVFFCTK